MLSTSGIANVTRPGAVMLPQSLAVATNTLKAVETKRGVPKSPEELLVIYSFKMLNLINLICLKDNFNFINDVELNDFFVRLCKSG